MAIHQMTGKEGEDKAVQYLIAAGYTILHRNWRNAKQEIDVIASRGTVLHFIEIKTRRSTRHGLPEQQVNTKKIRQMSLAAEAYLYQYPLWKRIQFDIVAVLLLPLQSPQLLLIEDIAL